MGDRLVLSVDYFTIGTIDLGRSTVITKPYSEYWCNRLFGDFTEILVVWTNDNEREERTVKDFFITEECDSVNLWLQSVKGSTVGPHFWWNSFRDEHSNIWNSDDILGLLEVFSLWMAKDEGKEAPNRHDMAVLFCEKYENLFDTVHRDTIFRAFSAFRSNQTAFYVQRCFVEDIDENYQRR